MQEKLNVAIIGCGRISNKHLEVLDDSESGGRLVAVCDVKEERAKEKASKYQVPYYLDYKDMLQSHKEIDVVSILTPSGRHYEHIAAVSPYVKNLIVEKPFVIKREHVNFLEEKIEKNNQRIFVVMQNRYNPPVRAAYRALQEGRFGKLVLGSLKVYWTRHQDYYDMDDWRGTWKLDGGALSQQGIHFIDMLQWFFGPVESVFANIKTNLLNIEVEDTAVVVFEFESGMLCTFEITVATRPSMWGSSFSILGGDGFVKIGGIALNKIEEWKFNGEAADPQEMSKLSAEVATVYGNSHKTYLEDVFLSIKDEKTKKDLAEGKEGLKSVKILNAIYKSAEVGQKIYLDYSPKKYLLGHV